MVGNKYVSKSAKKTSFPMLVGQRLLTGRLAIAQATVVFAKGLFNQTKKFSDSKECWAPGNTRPMLSDMPQLATLYTKAFKELDALEAFSLDVERRLSHCLKNEIAPDADLTEAIAVCKVKCVDRAIELTFRLKQEVGSYALMGGTGFEVS
jgi:acyl-CoA oxidase